jgi:O-antigen ligase
MLIICFITASAYTLLQLTELAGEMEANSILRALYWLEALQGFWDSSVIGVGFGKEATSHDYPLLLGALPPSSFHEFMVNGIHNSFLSMFFRLGLLGGLAFTWFFFITCLPSDKSHPNVARHAAIVYFACFMSNFVNVGVESPRMLIGNAFCLGYLLACKAVAEKNYSLRVPQSGTFSLGTTVPRP